MPHIRHKERNVTSPSNQRLRRLPIPLQIRALGTLWRSFSRQVTPRNKSRWASLEWAIQQKDVDPDGKDWVWNVFGPCDT